MSNEETNIEKPVKAPGAFKKPIKKETFQKKYLKYIEHTGNKSFFMSCFDEQDGAYVIRKSISKDDVKKIKSILKTIKANKKSAIKVVPLLFAGAVVAAIVFFFVVFANPLLESALETGLEAIFEAKSDVYNFRLSILKFEISMRKITIANRDRPMTNLFEMGRTVIKLKPEAVLRGKIYIEAVRADGISFGTPRTVSGALPARPGKVKQPKPKNDAPPIVDLKNFDAMALLNQEYDKLNTPRLYDEAIKAYDETAAKWQGQVENSTKRVAELRTSIQPILNMNVNSVSDVNAIRTTIQDITTMVNTVQSATNDVKSMVSDLETDVNTVRRLETNARNALTDDINHLKSYIDLGSGAAFNALEPFIRDVLSDAGDQYLDYGLMALETLEKIKANSAQKPKTEKPKKQPKVVFRGRDVAFPVVSYPAFYLGVFASDVTQGSWNGDFDLRNISSDPELTYRQTGKPVSLTVGATEISGDLRREIRFDGSADFRDNPQERFSAKVTGKGFPVGLGEELSGAGIGGFSGETAFSLFVNGKPDGAFTGGGDVDITQARLLDPRGTIAEAAAAAVSQAGNINLGIQYIHNIGQSDEFKLTTNIADLIARALRNTAEAYARKAIDDIEKALRARIDEYIGDRMASKEQVDLLLRSARGDSAAIDSLKSGLDAKKAEYEQKLRGAAEGAAQQAIQNALPSLPSLPGFPRR
jgi:uncharacterized protein (TIGR03545 family)